MTAVSHLLTLVDLSATYDPGPDARELHVDAHLHAVLDDGRRVVLRDDRGWSSWLHGDDSSAWAYETVEDMQETARPVVVPEEADWDLLAGDLLEHGVEITADELAALRHDVELSERVLARIGHGR